MVQSLAVESEANSPSRSAHHAVKLTLAITCAGVGALALASGRNFPKRVVVFVVHCTYRWPQGR